MRTLKQGFTLIEMLVVIVILGILVGAGLGAYGHFMEQARQKNAADVCAQLAAAWTTYHNDVGFWPDAVKRSGTQEMDTDMCAILGKAGAFDVMYIDSSNSNDTASGLKRNRDSESELRYGLLDPIGLKRFRQGMSGNAVTDHLYQFVLDDDEDGVIELPSEVGGGTVRADAAVWCWPEDEADRNAGITYAQSW